jgi:flagellar hook-associated protein 3 FlgL
MIPSLSPATNEFLNNLSSLQSLIYTTTDQMTSGYRINQPSDAPDQISPLLQLMANLSQNQTVLENLTNVQTTVNSADQAVSSAIQLLQQATSLGAEGASSTTPAQTRADLAQQIESIQEQMVSLADTKVTGSYIFAGDQSTSPPYASGPPPVTLGSAAAVLINPGDSANFTIQTATGQTQFSITGQVNDTLQDQLNELNSNLESLGIAASFDSSGKLQLQSANAFSASAFATTVQNLVATTPAAANNTGLDTYQFSGQAPGAGGGNDLQVTIGGVNVTATLPDGLGTADQNNVDAINTALQTAGITTVSALLDLTQTGTISFQGAASFSISDDDVTSGSYTLDGSSTVTAANGVNRLNAQQQVTSQIDLGDHTFTSVSQTAQNLFDHRNADDSAAPDNVFAALNSLRIALLNNDTSGVIAAQTLLDTASQYLNSQDVFYGAATNRISAATNRLNTENVNLQQQISAVRDTDTVAAAETLTAANTQEQAAMEAEAKFPQTTLFDYLG